MNKYKQKLISFAAAAAMLVSALPVQVWAVNNTTDAANYYYAIDGSESWTKSSDVTVNQAQTTVTITGGANDGFAYIELPGNVPDSGRVDIDFTFTLDTDSEKTTISLLTDEPTLETSQAEILKDNKYFHIFKDNKKQVKLATGSNRTINDTYTSEIAYTLNSIFNYDEDKLYWTIGNAKDEESIPTEYYAKFLCVYVPQGAKVVISDFVIKAEGATPPTDEPTEAPVETKAPVVTDTPDENDSDFIYNLDTDGRDNKGWTTDSASGTAGGGSVSYNNDQLTLTNTAQGDRSQTVTFERTDNMADQVKIDLTLTMTADKDGDVGTASGAYTHFKLTDENENDILALMLGNDGMNQLFILTAMIPG